MNSKIIYLSIIISLAATGFVKGSCIEYGHSCWGAHGKRSTGKIYRSIDGSESQQSEGTDELRPSELLNMFLERSLGMNLDESTNPHDFDKGRNTDEDQYLSEQQLKRKHRIFGIEMKRK